MRERRRPLAGPAEPARADRGPEGRNPRPIGRRSPARRTSSQVSETIVGAFEPLDRAHRDSEIVGGSLPDRALRLVREWATLHREELEADWRLAREGQPLERIPPLP
jgi:hypothetical protein